MKTNQMFISFCLANACIALPMPVLADIKVSSSPSKPTAGHVLDRNEFHILENIAHRAESMMQLSNFIHTRVWPHAVTDARGRQGIFIDSSRPVLQENEGPLAIAKRPWVVFGLIAALKYAEGTSLGHIAFTDTDSFKKGRYYYDLDIILAREIQRDLLRGRLTPEQAYDAIVKHWEKITPTQGIALK
jgi:hypothetical protein